MRSFIKMVKNFFTSMHYITYGPQEGCS